MRNEFFDLRGYHDTPVIPHILKTNQDGSVDMVTDGPMFPSDRYTVNPGGEFVITSVIESRPAKGDWSGESYKWMTPTWNRIKSRRG
jgi:hypothetical protein